ncbi:hypothetical protein AAMO2058_000062600 [Amorphochlora amoebiformis]
MLGRAHTGGMGKADVLLQEHRRAMAAKQLWIWAASCMFHFLVWFWHWQNKRVVLHRGHKKAVKQMASRQILLPFFETIIWFSLTVSFFRGGCVYYLVENYGGVPPLDQWGSLPIGECITFGLLLLSVSLFQISFVPLYLLKNTIGRRVYYWALMCSFLLSGILFILSMLPPAFTYLADNFSEEVFAIGGDWARRFLQSKNNYPYPTIAYLGFVAFGCLCMLVLVLQHKNPRWGWRLQAYLALAAAYYAALIFSLVHLDTSFGTWGGGGGRKGGISDPAEVAKQVISWSDSLMSLAFPLLLFLTLQEEAQWWRHFALQMMGMGRLMRGMENIPIRTAHQMLRGQLEMVDFAELEFLGRGGSGASGAVFRCRYKDKLVAAKSFLEKAISIPDLLRVGKEALLCHRIRHENIVEFIGMCISPPNLYLVFEWCTHRSLLQMLLDLMKTQLTWRTRVRFAMEVARGLNALHENGVVHRDVKTENVLVTLNKNGRFTCKLCDFGSSRLLKTITTFFPDHQPPKPHASTQSQLSASSLQPPEAKTKKPSLNFSEHVSNATTHTSRRSENVSESGDYSGYQMDVKDEARIGVGVEEEGGRTGNNERRGSIFKGEVGMGIYTTRAFHEDNYLTGLVGTPAYMAPELLGNIHCGQNAITALARRVYYGLAVDSFSFGYVMWELLTRRQVYSSKKFSFTEIHRQVLQGKRPTIPAPMACQFLHNDFSALIRECWSAEAARRPSSAELTTRIRHIYQEIRKIQKFETPAIHAIDIPTDNIEYRPLARKST